MSTDNKIILPSIGKKRVINENFTANKKSKNLQVTTKYFIKNSTNLNNVQPVKILREHYLRDDIPCSVKKCQVCQYDSASTDSKPILEDSDTLSNNKNHIAILDTNVVVNCIDMIENEKIFNNIIIPQTALDELKNLSFPIYKRLKSIIGSTELSDDENKYKNISVFYNEFMNKTYCDRLPTESINDRNDRSIRKLAKYLDYHLNHNTKKNQSLDIQIVLITNDKLNLQKCKEIGVNAMNIYQYIDNLSNSEELKDMIPQYDLTADHKINDKDADVSKALQRTSMTNIIQTQEYLLV